MRTEHTPGPWEAVTYDGAFDQPLIKSGHGTIGRLHGMEDRQHEANAKLIAAAPELLEALQVCYASLCTYGRHPLIEKQVESAIKKATE